MRYPCLIPASICKTPVHIELYQEKLNKYGETPLALELDTKCNYQSTTKIVYDDKKKKIINSANVYIPGDIAPGLPTIGEGTVEVFGIKRSIAEGIKALNPDATVNYTQLRLE